MKGKLVAAGGVLITGAALFGLAGPAGAEAGPCQLSAADISHPLWAGGWGDRAGLRRPGACIDLARTTRPITYDADLYNRSGYEDWYRTGWGRDPYATFESAPIRIYLDRHPSRQEERTWVSRWGSPGWSARSAWDDGG
ncbi:hypothetical protein [Nonomuraea sp. B19D2]|uniref:hypothetical protein n=1 Tax=Nonomuraea sp. B19D2 TaxID=3159561 RepID=UPI0032DBD7FF